MNNVEDIYSLSPEQSEWLEARACVQLLHAELVLSESVASEGRRSLWNDAWSRVLKRHSVLRTLFIESENDGVQQVVRERVTAEWGFHDLRHVPSAEKEDERDRVMRRHLDAQFDLARAPLVRGCLLTTSESEAHLLFAWHPLVLDRYSAAAAISELLAIYGALLRGSDPSLPMSRPFRDYIGWLAQRGDTREPRAGRPAVLDGDEVMLGPFTRLMSDQPSAAAIAPSPNLITPDGVAVKQIRWHVNFPVPLGLGTGLPRKPLQFSLFYFGDADSETRVDRYRLYLDSAQFADRNGFTAVWTPERHFHENGGLYPNPSVLSAALATVTRNVALRAGSVVLPLHHTERVAEEWSIVDNLSGGRVGLSFAPGWVPNDFAFFPERFADKREHMFRQIGDLQRLWSGGRIAARDGLGNEYEVRVFPRPVQAALPVWITCSGDPKVFERAAEMRCSVLTALITLSMDDLARRIELYRERISAVSGGTDRGHVTLMIHTYVGEEEAVTRELVRPALSKFLGTHVELLRTIRQSQQSSLDLDEEQLIAFAFEKYYRAASLIGARAKCMAMVERLRTIGVDEVACLIDFGLDVQTVLEGLVRLQNLKEVCEATI